jgi:hypothetical protein
MAGAAGLPTILCDMSSPMRERVALGISSTHEIVGNPAAPAMLASAACNVVNVAMDGVSTQIILRAAPHTCFNPDTRDHIPTGMGKLTVEKPDGSWETQLLQNASIMQHVIITPEGMPPHAELRVPISRTARIDLPINNLVQAMTWGRESNLHLSPGGTNYLDAQKVGIWLNQSGGVYEPRNGKQWRGAVISVVGITESNLNHPC